MIDNIAGYVHLELVVLVPVLYFIGLGLKKRWARIKNSIPLILMLVGVTLAMFWVVGANYFSLHSVFTAVTQGVICAGLAVFGHELIKKRAEGVDA